MNGWIEHGLNRRNETMLYVVLGVMSTALRFYHLAAAPLSAAEAESALSAWRLASGAAEIGEAARLPLSPLLHTLQTLTFWLTGNPSTWLARFWPALAGSMVVCWPLLLRWRIGYGAALISVCFFALSPVLWSVSRTGGGMTLSLLCGMLMVAGWRWFAGGIERRGLTLAAIGFGAGMAAGPQFVTLLFLGGAILLMRPKILRGFWGRLLPLMPVLVLPVALTFLISATAFLRYPLGLSAAGEAWISWFSNWIPVAGQRPAFLIPVLAALHEPVVVVLGLSGAYMAARGYPLLKGLVALTGVGLSFGVVYGGREAADVVWMLLPLTLLASLVVDATWSWARVHSELFIVALQVSALLMLAGFAYALVAAFASGRGAHWLAGGWDAVLQLGILLSLGVLVVLLFASGWSRSAAWCGTVTTLVIAMVGWSAHSRTILAGERPETGLDMWYGERPSVSRELMLESVERVSLRAVGESREIEIAVLGDANKRLAWLLRGFPNVKWISFPSNGISSPVVIVAGELSTDVLEAKYIGQEFGDNVYRRGAPIDSIGWAKYFLFRSGPVRQTKMVLWVREDVYSALGAAG